MRKLAPVLLCLTGLLLALPAQARIQSEKVHVGHDITVGPDETTRDLVCFGCSINVEGTVKGDIAVFGGDANVQGRVTGDVAAFGGDIHLGPAAELGGDAAALGGQVQRAPGAKVGGKITSGGVLVGVGLAGLFLFVVLLGLVIHVVLVLITFAVAGQPRVEVLAATVRQRAGTSVLLGIGLTLVAVVIVVLSFLMGPVWPFLCGLTVLALFVALVVGYTGLSFWMGRLVAKNASPVAALLLGVVLITLLEIIPFVSLIFYLLALGIAALSGFGAATDWLERQFAPQPALPPAAPPPTS